MPAAPDRRVGLRRAVVVDRVRAAGQDDRLACRGAPAPPAACRRAAARSRRSARAPGARSAGRTGCRSRGRRPCRRLGPPAGWSSADAFGCRRVERGLEVRLDLGVVGGEDPVPGIGRPRRGRSCRAPTGAPPAGPRCPPMPPSSTRFAPSRSLRGTVPPRTASAGRDDAARWRNRTASSVRRTANRGRRLVAGQAWEASGGGSGLLA